jgi:steroid delta-isomerase-like uncharacterized protein
MSADANRAALLALYERGTSQGDLAVIDEVVAHDVTIHSAIPGAPQGADGLRAGVAMLRSAFGELKATPIDVVADADQVAARFRLTGVHVGDAFGIPATGATFAIDEIAFGQFRDGRLVSLSTHADMFSLLKQLGAL